jgi:hypothetical protein
MSWRGRGVRTGYILAAVLVGVTVTGCALPQLVPSTGGAVFAVCAVALLGLLAKPIGKALALIIRALW